jgi:ribonuclease HI
MELQAAIEALSAVRRRGSNILVLSDNEHLIHSCTKWIPMWKAGGWKRKTGPVANLDLQQHLDQLMTQHTIEWRWLRGHAGEPGNEHVDKLARGAMERLVTGNAIRLERRFTWTLPLPYRANSHALR